MAVKGLRSLSVLDFNIPSTVQGHLRMYNTLLKSIINTCNVGLASLASLILAACWSLIVFLIFCIYIERELFFNIYIYIVLFSVFQADSLHCHGTEILSNFSCHSCWDSNPQPFIMSLELYHWAIPADPLLLLLVFSTWGVSSWV